MKASPSAEADFLALYEEFADAIFRHCFFKVSNRDVATDLTQETFIRAWQYIAKGMEIENARAFLYRIATNLTIDYYRKKRETSLDQLLEAGFEPGENTEERLYDSLDGRRMLELVKTLDPKYRDVVLMRYVEGLSPKEIAEIIDETENVVSVRLHRALKKVSELWK
jgi:RNA polymerase sigma-70 factor, ECF subfamily